MTLMLRKVDVRRFASFRISLILPLIVGCAHAVYDNQPGDQSTTGFVSDPTASAGSLSSNLASSLPSDTDPDASGGTPGTSDTAGAPSTASDGGATNSAGSTGSGFASAGSSTAGAAAGGSSGMAASSGAAGMPTAGSGGSTTTGGAGAPPASAGAASVGGSAGTSSGGTTSGGGSSAGASSAGAPSAGASGNSCANIATWKLSTYSAGDLVQSGGKIYKCKEYPYVGWCGSNVAYAPISGYAWMDAWDLVGPC
ncbi:MAG TPA: hypothetical protein VHW01_11720 [Polyangiaceae bacterium]|nr:hypothetical protein [Polyangiaceae bacterium]